MVVILLFALDKGRLLLRRMVGFEGRPAPSISRLFSAASNFNALGPHNFGLIAATRVCQVSLGRFGLRSMRCRGSCFSEVGAITPHRKQDARELSRQGDRGDALASPELNPVGPCAKRFGVGASASEQLPRRLHQKRAHTSIAGLGDVAAVLFLSAAELRRHQS